MIQIREKTFHLITKNTSYIFEISPAGHPIHIYYGRRLPSVDTNALSVKHDIPYGSSVEYSPSTPGYCLDTQMLEYSGIGKGDFRHTPLECILPDGCFTTDFVYTDSKVEDTAFLPNCGLPYAHSTAQTLTVSFCDKKFATIKLHLIYTVFEECDVIARAVQISNDSDGTIQIRKVMSLMMDIPEAQYQLLTLDGGWAKEAHIHTRPVSYGIHITDSTTGGSSNRHNPGFLLLENGANELTGNVVGFNLIYSGNHYSAVELSGHDTLRVMCGISPHCFLWNVLPGETFTTPQAVMSFSDAGLNGFSANMHDFVNTHVIRPEYQNSLRPVVINNWESTFFNFTKSCLLRLAQKAKKLGVEMFVVDDGWFGKRNSDTAGLGDWVVNKKKIPGGITGLCKKINQIGLRFGLWFEPECINPDSDLYRTHPDWAISIPGREASLGRNQMVLDLTRKEVRDYIVDAVDKVLSSANIEYVKWDYNRHISDMYSSAITNQGEFFHRYILGLYDILNRIFCQKHPNVLLESCSSGGNRFDLGMLSYSAQVWTSDNTDAAERLDIQRGIYCFYPPSTVSNHVSMTPNQQTLRNVALSTRFNVAAFGVLGYELDFNELTPEEQKQIQKQIAFYKAHRKTFQYGHFMRYFPVPGQRESWQISKNAECISAIYNLSYHACPGKDKLRILSAKSGKRYSMKTVTQYLRLARFGGLVKHISPVAPKADGLIMRTVDRHFALCDGSESYVCSGDTLNAGVQLAMQYSGTGYTDSLRVLGDWGSTMYLIKEEKQS